MISRITIKDIAKRAGVHHSTVSRALRNSNRISENARKTIQSLAAEMGYKPDPAISALTAYRTTKRPANYQSTIAWITNHPTPDGVRSSCFEEYYNGAAERAAELGFKLEEFWLRQPLPKGRNFSQVLKARNILGLLVAPQYRAFSHVHIDWDQFIAIRFGYTMARPNLHMVASNHFLSITIIVRKLRALGYRNIGFIMTPELDKRVNNLYSAAYYSEQRRADGDGCIPIFIYSHPSELSALPTWIKTHRIDAVIGSDIDILKMIESQGIRVPQDIGFALTFRNPRFPHVAGIDENLHLTGAVAMEWLVRMIQSGEQGLPELPQCLLVAGTWHDGKSVGRITRPLISSPAENR